MKFLKYVLVGQDESCFDIPDLCHVGVRLLVGIIFNSFDIIQKINCFHHHHHIYIYIYIYIYICLVWFGLVRWVLWHTSLVGYLILNPFLCKLSFPFQTIQFSMSTQFNSQKTFLFQTIQAVIYNNSV